MKKAIVANSIIALATLGIVMSLSVNAVEAPEEPAPLNVTTTVTTTLSQVTTRCSTVNVKPVTKATTIRTARAAPCTTLEPEINIIETEDYNCQEEYCITEVEESVYTEAVPESIEEYIVYKPSTKYVHRSSCRWNSGDAVAITDTNNIEARKCTECNPDIEIVNEYIEPEPTVEECGLTEDEIILLRKIVSYEYGSDWVPVYEKAKVVNGVMNRVYDSRFPNTIYDVLTQSGQFPGFYTYGTYYMSDSIIAAVDYYFAHPDEFDSSNSWYADGCGYNVFYYQ